MAVTRQQQFAGVLLFILSPALGMAQTECAGCHRRIVETYRRTGMGRSFYRPSSANAIEDFGAKSTYYHPASNSYFQMLHRDGALYQRRYQLDPDGKQVNVMEKRVDYIIGSGNHARAYLHRTAAGGLIELPLGWYAEKGGYWAMNPGYDRPSHDGFRRPITYDCMFCHNAYPSIPAGHNQPFAPAIYSGALPEGIDCQRCHGSGKRHINLARTSGTKRDDIRKAIVNPSRLSTDRQMEICLACHLESTSFPLPNAIQRYGRGPFSYHPGEPLGDFILNFDHAPEGGRDEKFEIVNAGYRLRRSACFLKSDGKMLCTTCHNPHDVPRGEAAQRYYDSACRRCHSADFERKVASGAHTSRSNCAGCHMPKLRTEDVVHAVATDHLIRRHKPSGDLLADRPERQETGTRAYRGRVVLHYPEWLPPTPDNELYLAVAQVKQGSNLKDGIPQLTALIEKYSPDRAEWYLELAEALENSGQQAQAIRVYRDSLRRNPRFAPALQRLGTALRKSSQHAEAADVLKQATIVAPANPIAWHELGLTYQALGQTQKAIAAIGRALQLDPELPEAQNNLGILRLSSGNATGAETAFREAIRIRPEYADAHANLANVLSVAGNFTEAQREFETALGLRQSDAATRYNYAMMLGRMKRYDDAQAQLEASLQVDPNFVDAHLLLGDVLIGRNCAREAARHYREALRMEPGSSRAHLGVAAAFLADGDVQSALPHLKQAAAGTDSSIRESALDMIRRIQPPR